MPNNIVPHQNPAMVNQPNPNLLPQTNYSKSLSIYNNLKMPSIFVIYYLDMSNSTPKSIPKSIVNNVTPSHTSDYIPHIGSSSVAMHVYINIVLFS